MSFEFITTLVALKKRGEKGMVGLELVIVFYLELKVGLTLQNGNNDDNVFLKSFSLSCVYKKRSKTNIQTNKKLTTNLEFIVIVSAIEPTIKKQKRRKW